VKRFVDCVESGQILKATEFAGAVSVTASNTFRDAGALQFDSGAMVDPAKIVLLFRCRNDLMEQGLGAWLDWDGDKIKRVDVTANEIRTERPN
jgi:hypothetical protein